MNRRKDRVGLDQFLEWSEVLAALFLVKKYFCQDMNVSISDDNIWEN